MASKKKLKTTQSFGDSVRFFLNTYKKDLENIVSRLSDFFEMKIYNDVVRAYEQLGYSCKPMQLINGNQFKYKLSPSGLITNFSFFEIEKNNQRFWIIHNLKCESASYNDCYVTADVCVIDENSTMRKAVDNKNVDFVPNSHLRTFFECKFMSPFPELIANFVGLVTVLMPDCLEKKSRTKQHVAPTLVCANNGSKNSYRFANAVQRKHDVNVLNNMAYRTIKARILKREAKLI